jgi:hypothetical protein
LEGSVQRIGGELGGMALCRREAADCLVNSVYIDQSSL